MHERHGHAVGYRRSSTHQAWTNMKMRCCNPNRPDYEFYGGRGIKVCPRWLASFENFLADMGEKPVGKSLDRWPNNDGNYEPSNCRWATKHEQMQNTRATKLIEFGGKTQGVAAWARELGICNAAMQRRLKMWPLEMAMTKQPKPDHRRKDS